jgi:hypothetical protein
MSRCLYNLAKIFMPIFQISPIFSSEEYYAPKKYHGILKSHNVPHFHVFANFFQNSSQYDHSANIRVIKVKIIPLKTSIS